VGKKNELFRFHHYKGRELWCKIKKGKKTSASFGKGWAEDPSRTSETAMRNVSEKTWGWGKNNWDKNNEKGETRNSQTKKIQNLKSHGTKE